MATSKKSVTAPAVEEVKAAAPAAKPKAASKTAAKEAAKPAVADKAPAKAPVKPVAKKVAAKAPAKKAPKAAAPKKVKPPVVQSADIDPSQRAHYIEVAAYYIAERRGFTPGDPAQDYLDAAAEIDRLIEAGHFGK